MRTLRPNAGKWNSAEKSHQQTLLGDAWPIELRVRKVQKVFRWRRRPEKTRRQAPEISAKVFLLEVQQEFSIWNQTEAMH
jgi:hypothetical protein